MIYMEGVSVDNRGKEKLLRAEIANLREQLSEMERNLKDKYEECEKLVDKIHKMGGRIKK